MRKPQTIGIIGAAGDLGSQLTVMAQAAGFVVMSATRQDDRNHLRKLLRQCAIVHLCAPVEVLETLPETKTMIVLHDSVMATSRQASRVYLDGRAGIVHMLMNKNRMVVVAQDAPHHTVLIDHFTRLGCHVAPMSIDEHDHLMARSQAPLALLCSSVLPFLHEQQQQGLLTPSGEVLAETLRARELAWTNQTMRSILKNPQLEGLLNDMKLAIETASTKKMETR